jgi:hypothetical protein
MGNRIIENEVDELMKRYKDKSYSEQIVLSLEYLDNQIKNQPLVILFHEMKKELLKKKSLI